MAIAVPAGVEFSYNGIVFPSNIRTEVNEEPVDSVDGRTAKCSKITISVSGYWTQDDANSIVGAAGAPIDSLMRVIRLQLQKHGKRLKYVAKGYGSDLDVNAPGDAGVRDVMYGPRAGKFTFKSIGGAPDGCHGCFFSWSVTTHIPECENARFQVTDGQNPFNELGYSVNYSTDEAGIVTITANGKASIPLALRSNNTISTNIDEYFDRLINAVPEGFLRRIERQISHDRASVTFTVTDRQIECPYPDDVVHIDMRHRIKQAAPLGPMWNCSISGSVRLKPTARKILAWRRFFGIVATRMEWARTHFYQQQGASIIRRPNSVNITRPQVEMEEDLFKNEAHFSVTFNILGAPLRFAILSSGLWQPIVDNPLADPDYVFNAQTWRTSLQPDAQSARGVLGAQYNAADDVIIDVCTNASPIQSQGLQFLEADQDINAVNESSGAAGPSSEDGPAGYNQAFEPGQLAAPNNEDDDGENQYEPEASWMAWQCEVRRVTDHHITRHKPLSGSPIIAKPPVDALADVDTVASEHSDPAASWTDGTPDIIQRRCAPSMILRLTGFAVRVAYRANAPKLVSYGGVAAVLAHEDIRERTLAMQDGVVFFRTDWVLDYIIPSAPASLPMPANPFIGVNGDGD